MATKELEIIKQIRFGNEHQYNQALRYVYKKHYEKIAAYILKNKGTAHDAEDVFQDAITVLFRKLKEEHMQLNCSIHTYLFAVSKNLWLKKLRKNQKMVYKLDEEESMELAEEHLSLLFTNERNEIMAKMIKKLKPDCVKILEAYYFDRMRMREIAEKFDISSEQVVKNKKARCLKCLKELVNANPFLNAYFLNIDS